LNILFWRAYIGIVVGKVPSVAVVHKAVAIVVAVVARYLPRVLIQVVFPERGTL
jgi:hypothetical protein